MKLAGGLVISDQGPFPFPSDERIVTYGLTRPVGSLKIVTARSGGPSRVVAG